MHCLQAHLTSYRTLCQATSAFCNTAVSAQNLMERAVVLGHGANQEETSPALASLVSQYASILAAQVGIAPCLHCSCSRAVA